MASGRPGFRRQRSKQSRRASESAPPETARATRRASAMAAKSGSSSPSATATTASAARTGLFNGDPLAERVRRLRILLQDLRVGRTGGIALAEASEREAEFQ